MSQSQDRACDANSKLLESDLVYLRILGAPNPGNSKNIWAQTIQHIRIYKYNLPEYVGGKMCKPGSQDLLQSIVCHRLYW